MISITLKRLRQNNSFTQQQVADALNIDRSTYAYYESGKTTPDINALIKLARVFNVSFNDLLEDENLPQGVADTGRSEYRYQNRARISNTVYELTKAEKQLIIYFRIMSPERQKELLDKLADKIDSLEQQRKKKEQK